MGLDVYLIPKEVEETNNERNQVWEALYKRKESGEIDEEEYKRLNAELPKWERYPTIDSKQHGEHLFNRRYLRSSYNDGGFNSAVPEMIGEEGKDLYWVFEGVLGGDEYEVTLTKASIPALKEARKRSLWLAEKLRAQTSLLRVDTIDAVSFFDKKPKETTSSQALDWYREQAEKEHSFGWWSNAKGHFWGKPDDPDAGLRVLGVVPGTGPLGNPAVHLIFEVSSEVMEEYAKSADITAEFCEEAIELVKRDGQAYIHWSA